MHFNKEGERRIAVGINGLRVRVLLFVFHSFKYFHKIKTKIELPTFLYAFLPAQRKQKLNDI